MMAVRPAPIRALLSHLTATALLLLLAATAGAQTIREDFYVTDGPVQVTALSGNTLYIGGTFTQVGPSTGGGVPVDGTSGVPAGGFPKVDGTIRAAVPDGAGGWYIGGLFTTVGQSQRSNLAHVLADLSVADWNPSPDYVVLALAVSGSTVYVGGDFTMLGSSIRSYLAAVDASSGDVTVWAPEPNGPVYALAVDGGTVYAGGNFGQIGGQSRTNLAALSATTGDATSWDAGMTGGYVKALALSGTTLYVGGSFSPIGGQTRPNLAAVSTVTGSATGWNPSPNSEVRALAVGGDPGVAAHLDPQVQEAVAAVCDTEAAVLRLHRDRIPPSM